MKMSAAMWSGFNMNPFLPLPPGVPALLHGLLHHLQSGDSVSRRSGRHPVISHLTSLPRDADSSSFPPALTTCSYCTSHKAPLALAALLSSCLWNESSIEVFRDLKWQPRFPRNFYRSHSNVKLHKKKKKDTLWLLDVILSGERAQTFLRAPQNTLIETLLCCLSRERGSLRCQSVFCGSLASFSVQLLRRKESALVKSSKSGLFVATSPLWSSF